VGSGPVAPTSPIVTEREQHESIARDFAEQGLLLSYTRAYVGTARQAQWVPLLHDVEVGGTTRYPRGATKLEAAKGAWKLFVRARSAES
jgi:hypothetical protein